MLRGPLLLLSLGLAAALAACGGAGSSPPAAPAAGGRGAPQAMPVSVLSVVPAEVAITSTYVASVQSRHSAVISPLVPGLLTAIEVKSGAVVSKGQPLFQLDASVQQAAVANLKNSLASLEATLDFDQTQMQRFQQLYQAKVGTLQDFQSAQSTYNTAKEQANALRSQIQQQSVILSYYTVTAPDDGIIGDIPVRVGDQVTTATQLTTLDQREGQEVYVEVPVEQAGQLKTGLRLEVLDGNGQPLASSSIYFVSPQVDNLTQTILAKAALSPEQGQRVRNQQYVQARITWGTHSAYLVPLLAVSQLGDKNFVDLAAPQGTGFAMQPAPVTVGGVQGNNDEITDGLKPGDKVIVSTTQILAPGMPVMPMPAGAKPPTGAPPGR